MPRAKSKRRAYSSHWSRNVRGFEDPDISTHTLLIKFEDLIGMAMGPSDVNTIDFNILQRVLYVLAEQLNILERSVEFRLGVPGARAPPRSGEVTSTTAFTDRRDLPADQQRPRRHRRPHSRPNLERRDDYSDIEEGEEIYRDEKSAPKALDRDNRGRPKERDKEDKSPSRDRDDRGSERERDLGELSPSRGRDKDDRVRSKDTDDRDSRSGRVRDAQSLPRETDKYDRGQSRDTEDPKSTKDRDRHERGQPRQREKDDRGSTGARDRDERSPRRKRDKDDSGRSRDSDDRDSVGNIYRGERSPPWDTDKMGTRGRSRDKYDTGSARKRNRDEQIPPSERDQYSKGSLRDSDRDNQGSIRGRDRDEKGPLMVRYTEDKDRSRDSDDRNSARDRGQRKKRDKDVIGRLRGDRGSTEEKDRDRERWKDRDDQNSYSDSEQGIPPWVIDTDERSPYRERDRAEKGILKEKDIDSRSPFRETVKDVCARNLYGPVKERDKDDIGLPRDKDDSARDRDKRDPLNKRHKHDRDSPREKDKEDRDSVRDRDENGQMMPKDRDGKSLKGEKDKEDRGLYRDRDDNSLRKKRDREDRDSTRDKDDLDSAWDGDRGVITLAKDEEKDHRDPLRKKDRDDTDTLKKRDKDSRFPLKDKHDSGTFKIRDRDDQEGDMDNRDVSKKWDKDSGDRYDRSSTRDSDERGPSRQTYIDDSERFDTSPPIEWGDRSLSRERFRDLRRLPKEIEKYTKGLGERYKDKDLSRKKDKGGKESPREKDDNIQFIDRVSSGRTGKDDRRSTKDRYRGVSRESDSYKTNPSGRSDRGSDEIGSSRDRDNEGPYKDKEMEDERSMPKGRGIEERGPLREERGPSKEDDGYDRGSVKDRNKDDRDERGPSSRNKDDRDSPKESDRDEKGDIENRGPYKDRKKDKRGPLKERRVRDDKSPIKEHADSGDDRDREKGDKEPSRERDRDDRGPSRAKERDDTDSSRDTDDKKSPREVDRDKKYPSRDRKRYDKGPPRERDREDRGSLEDRDGDNIGPPRERDRDDKILLRERDQDDRGLSKNRDTDDHGLPREKERDDKDQSRVILKGDKGPSRERDQDDKGLSRDRDRDDKSPPGKKDKEDRGPSKDKVRGEISPSRGKEKDDRESSSETERYSGIPTVKGDEEGERPLKKVDREDTDFSRHRDRDDRVPSREDDMDDRDRTKKRDKTKKEKPKIKAARSSESGLGRASSVEVATLSDFEQLEQTVQALKDLTTPVPAPTLPDNEKLRADLAKGASLPEAMEALQVGARIVAAEQAIGQMTDIMTQLVSSGHLPREVLDKVNEVKSIVEEIEGEVGFAGVKGDDAKRISKQSIVSNYPETLGRKSKPAAVTLKTDTFPDMFPGTSDGKQPFDFGAVMLSVASSMTSRPASFVTGITHAELNDALKKFRDDFNKTLNNMALRAAATADTAATGIRALSDKFNAARSINSRLDTLNSQINDYAEQLDGFEAGLNIQLSGFHDIMNEITSDLKAGLAQLKDASSNAETAAVRELTERYDLLTGELTDKLDQHRHLTQYQLGLRDELRRLVEIVEALREQKADRDEVLDGLRDKADSNRLAGLLKMNDFEDALAHLNFRLDVCDDKFQKQSRQWLRAFTELDGIITSKAETSQMTGARDDWLKSIEELQAKLRSLASMLADPKAAVTTRKMLPDSKPPKRAPGQASVRPAVRLPPIGSSELADEECLYDWNLTGGRAEPYHYCHRACGGSHTLLSASVAREQAPQPPTTARCPGRYSAAGRDGKPYNMEEELLPCVECNQLSPEKTTQETGGGAPGDGAPGDGAGDQVH